MIIKKDAQMLVKLKMELSLTDGDIHAFEDSIVHSCPSCHLKNIEYILSPPSVHLKRESSCHQCLDWWHHGVTKSKIYPIQHECFLDKIKTSHRLSYHLKWSIINNFSPRVVFFKYLIKYPKGGCY